MKGSKYPRHCAQRNMARRHPQGSETTCCIETDGWQARLRPGNGLVARWRRWKYQPHGLYLLPSVLLDRPSFPLWASTPAPQQAYGTAADQWSLYLVYASCPQLRS